MGKNPIVIYCDGLCEPNPGGIATFGWVAFQGEKEVRRHQGLVGIGPGSTNNIAEYSGVISALEWFLSSRYNKKGVLIKSDSQLVVNQLNGLYAVKSPVIIPLHQKAASLARCGKVAFRLIPREENRAADELSREAYERALAAQKSTREYKAREIAPTVVPLPDGRFLVPSQSRPGIRYLVDVEKCSCTCPDFKNSRREFL